MTKCQVCKKSEAVYALQYIASSDPSLYTLGSHIRGFKVTKVCEECAEKLMAGKLEVQ